MRCRRHPIRKTISLSQISQFRFESLTTYNFHPPNQQQTKDKMKFTATVVAASVVAVSAFSPATTFVRVSLQSSLVQQY